MTDCSRKRLALLITYNAPHFRELFRLACMLHRSGSYLPLMLFVSPYPGLEKHYWQCLYSGFAAHIRGQHFDKKPSRLLMSIGLLPSAFYSILRFVSRKIIPRPVRTLLLPIYRALRRHYRVCIERIKEQLLCMKNNILSRIRSSDVLLVHTLRAIKERYYAGQMCRALAPDIVILAEDNVEYLSGAWIRAAHKNRTPVVIVPYCLAAIEEPAAVYVKDVKYHADTPDNIEFSQRYPHWVHEYQGRRLVRLPARRALPLEWLRISSPLPWVMNGSYADAIAVESQFMHDFYKRQGLPPKQFAVTGAVSDDILYASLRDSHNQRRELYRQFGVPEDKPMLLCALPPVTSAMDNLREEFPSYEAMIRFWLESLAQVDGYNIFISLHPTMERLQFQLLKEAGWWGLIIAPPDTARMIAICDLYIASVSSTIRWAIACGKPVINYDVYRFRFPDFRPARGVVTVETKEGFTAALQRITTDPLYYESLREAQLQCSSYWGIIDGQSSKRLLELFDRLILEYQATKAPSTMHILERLMHRSSIKTIRKSLQPIGGIPGHENIGTNSRSRRVSFYTQEERSSTR